MVGLKGDTALGVAVFEGHTSVVKLLLDRGADVRQNKHLDEGYDLFWAAQFGYKEIAHLLLEHGGQKARNTFYGKAALNIAVSQNFLDIVGLLKSYGIGADRT